MGVDDRPANREAEAGSESGFGPGASIELLENSELLARRKPLASVGDLESKLVSIDAREDVDRIRAGRVLVRVLDEVLWIHGLFPEQFKDFVFVSVGLVDSAQFKGVQELGALETRIREDLEKYVRLAERLGCYAEYRFTLGTDVTEELEHTCTALAGEFPSLTVFAGRLVFQRELLLTRSLHDQTAYSIQRRLLFHGIPVIILPVRVWDIAT